MTEADAPDKSEPVNGASSDTSGDSGAPGRRIEPWLLEVLACPQCRSPLTLGADSMSCTDIAGAACGLVFPVRDGIPVLLIDEALPRGDR